MINNLVRPRMLHRRCLARPEVTGLKNVVGGPVAMGFTLYTNKRYTKMEIDGQPKERVHFITLVKQELIQ